MKITAQAKLLMGTYDNFMTDINTAPEAWENLGLQFDMLARVRFTEAKRGPEGRYLSELAIDCRHHAQRAKTTA